MAESNVPTPWFHHRNDGNPTRPGVYQTRDIGADGDEADRVFYRQWTGRHWGYASYSPAGARSNGWRYGNQFVLWRGLVYPATDQAPHMAQQELRL